MSFTINEITEVLTDEGFRPKVDEGMIEFKASGLRYYILIDNRDEDFLRIFACFRIHDEDMTRELFYNILRLNTMQKLAKASILKQDSINSIMLSVDMIVTIDMFKKNLNRYMSALECLRNDLAKQD